MDKFNVEEFITKIAMDLVNVLSQQQLDLVKYSLVKNLVGVSLSKECTEVATDLDDNEDKVKLFMATKRMEGCSNGTLEQYALSIKMLLSCVNKNYSEITTNDVRFFLSEYQRVRGVSNTTLNNHRRNLNSFFNFLEQEDYIDKNPIRKIKKIKEEFKVKESLSEENVEVLKDSCKNYRDRAIIDFLYSTGIRISEMTGLNTRDINFIDGSCIVCGKGNKQRTVYFNAEAKIHLQNYLESRVDNNVALFVWKKAPYNRLNNCGVRDLLKNIAMAADVDHVHPHKFRRTFATHNINRGMRLEHIQMALGHVNPQTTLIYAQISQEALKYSYKQCMH